MHTETMLSSHAPPRLRGSAGEQDVPAQLLTSQLLSGTQNLTGAKQSTLIPLDSIRLRTPVDTSLPARSRGTSRDAVPPQPRYIRTIPPLDRCTAERKPARGNNSNPRDGRTPTRGWAGFRDCQTQGRLRAKQLFARCRANARSPTPGLRVFAGRTLKAPPQARMRDAIALRRRGAGTAPRCRGGGPARG